MGISVSSTRRGVCKLWPIGQIQPAVFINKVCTECSHNHLFTTVCSCFYVTTMELSSWDREHTVYQILNYLLVGLRQKMIARSYTRRSGTLAELFTSLPKPSCHSSGTYSYSFPSCYKMLCNKKCKTVTTTKKPPH